jgi:two-component system sensor histidine kinase KdpD
MSSAHEERRPDPDALIAAAEQERKGRLKVFLGMAPGVGKTWEMLAAARLKKAEGVDVVIGLVETHGRPDTAAQIGDLPVLPRRKILYRGRELEEFDLDAALARRPQLLLLDELAHTNVPGSRHAKRWEDALELLEAGIDVWTTLNIQHLESLNEAVARITGVRVAETIPDRILSLADDIEVIDLPPAELRARLAEGKIYPPENAARALRGFFREGNLAALREMALRRAAQHVDANVSRYMRAKAIAGPWPAGERILALIGADSADAEAVVRHAAHLAESFRAPWIVFHVERPGESDEPQSALTLAAELGAETVTVTASDVLGTILRFAAERNVTQIVVGRGRPSLWRRLTGRTLTRLLAQRATDFALHVIPRPVGRRPSPAAPAKGASPLKTLRPWLMASLLVALVTGLGELFPAIPEEAMGMLFLAAVVVAASLYGLAVALYTALIGFLAWNFFFIPPLYVLTVSDTKDVIAIFVFLTVAVIAGTTASKVRREAEVAQARVESLRRIGNFSRALGAASTEPELFAELARQAEGLAGSAVVLAGTLQDDLHPVAQRPAELTLEDIDRAAARWAASHREPAGAGTSTLPAAHFRFLPLRLSAEPAVVLGVAASTPLPEPLAQALTTLAELAALSLERLRLAGEAARSAAQQESQRLRTALLSSLSHDLRTPLAAMRGAAETLRTKWDDLPPETRNDLLRSIEHDTGRITRFLTNITDMTRLESGEIVPRLVPTDLGEVIEAAIGRLEDGLLVSVNLPPDLPRVAADPVLIEQVLLNVLGNAIKFSPPNSLVSVVAERKGEEVEIRVSDEGIGIPPEDLPHVFDSFYRAQRGDRTAPGSGLGLAIAKGFIEAMGGRIAVQSPRPDASAEGFPGTVVTLWLKVWHERPPQS